MVTTSWPSPRPLYKGTLARSPSTKGDDKLLFDFEKFSNLAGAVYRNCDVPYSLQDVLMVSRCYFGSYERCMEHPHPPIKATQIRRIIQEMPWICPEDKGSRFADIDPECYTDIIHQHFNTRYRNCDYNINHFFSGKVRELRYFELLRKDDEN